MIKLTNDVKAFMEKEQGDLILYGAGNSGYWIGFYMDRCGINYLYYIDKNVGHADALFNGHRVFPMHKLKQLDGKHIRIVITPKVYGEIITELMLEETRLKLDATLFVPISMDVTLGYKRYNINHFLGYFRRRLLKRDFPTIISNNCLAGFIYDAFDMPLLSPTINMGFEPEDFIEFCENFDYYIDLEMVEIGRTRDVENPNHHLDFITGQIGDVRAVFIGNDHPVDRWNMMRTRINRDRILFIMTNQLGEVQSVPISVVKRFKNLDREHLYIDQYNGYLCDDENSIYMPKKYLNERESAIENYFDLLGWLNLGVEHGKA